jgi:hypothetical protein
MTSRNDHTAEGDPEPSRTPVWLRRELIIAGVFVPIGAILLPIAIYMVGQSLLGTYSEQGYGIGRLYGDIFSDLAAGFPAAWILVLSPWLAVQLLRLSVIPLRRRHVGDHQPTD